MQRIVNRSVNKAKEVAKMLSLEMAVVLFVFFSSFCIVFFLIRQVFVHETFSLDAEAFIFLERFISDRSNALMTFFTFFGSHKFLVPANLILIFTAFFVLKDKWFGIKIIAVAISSLLLMIGLKALFGRPRPLEPLLSKASGLSFPSGHAFMSFAFFGLLIYISYKKIENRLLRSITIILLLMLIIIISISRIYLRVHYLSDVIAGLCLGMMWLSISLYVLNNLEKRNKPKVQIT